MSTTPFSVSGKTAIITGAGSGICLSFASLLLSRGCNVAIADLALRPEAQELVAKYSNNSGSSSSPRAIFIETDVTSWPALSQMIEKTLAEFGAFDILCPGAGVYEPHWSNFWHPPGSPLSRDDPAAGHYALLDINLTHPIRATQLALSHWLYPRAGSPQAPASATNPKCVVHISSVAGQLPNFVAPLYGASKFAITGFVRCMAKLEGAHGVRVSAVAPGVVRTPLWTEHPEKMINLDAEQDGWVTPEEVADAMLRCVEDAGVPGGSVLEVGKNSTRLVGVLNDPGPDMDPAGGLVVRNLDKGVAEVKEWLGDEKVWGGSRP
ncbi:short-chain dehydrogenase [Camillea tinctor]|nr:short-chain dehydrogenase [Camillea tinctor]